MIPIPLLQTSDLKPAHFSRWIHLDLLLGDEEMRALVHSLEPLYLLSTTLLEDSDEPFIVSKTKFLEVYQNYINALKNGKNPNPSDFRKTFHLYWTTTLENISRVQLSSGHQKLDVPIPTIQTKPICLKLSSVDQSIHVAPISPSGFLWGMRFSFPGLYQRPGSHKIVNLNPTNDVNANLYKSLRSWVRRETSQPSFKYEVKVTSGLNLRLGKDCSQWIDNHPGQNKQLQVAIRS